MPESLGCSHSLILPLMHSAAQEHIQLNKTVLIYRPSEAGETFPNSRCFTCPFPAPQQLSQHRSSACSEMVPGCRIVPLGGNRSVLHTVFKEESELRCTLDSLSAAEKCSDKFIELSPTLVPPFENYCSRALIPLNSVLHRLPRRIGRQRLQHSALHQPSDLLRLRTGLWATANLYFSSFTILKLAFLC